MLTRLIQKSLALVLVLLVTSPVGAQARGGETMATDYPLSFRFSDPSGDSAGPIDVVSIEVAFDNTTSAYEIVLRSSEEAPFNGTFRVNINLFNPDTGTTACPPARFSDTFNDYTLTEPVRELVLTGTPLDEEDKVLKAWSLGHRVATNDTPFGNPDCSGAFGSAVLVNNQGDFIAEGNVHAVIRQPEVFADRFEPEAPAPNQAPAAGPSYWVIQASDQTQTIVLTGSDADGDNLTFEIVDPPSVGNLSAITSTGPTSAEVDYTSSGDFVSPDTDTFSFRTTDGSDSSEPETITIYAD